jgi:multidrug efflux pump subunit AcrB
MLQPLAIAVIGGLFLSIFLSLVVTPVIYYSLTRRGGVSKPTSALSLI